MNEYASFNIPKLSNLFGSRFLFNQFFVFHCGSLASQASYRTFLFDNRIIKNEIENQIKQVKILIAKTSPLLQMDNFLKHSRDNIHIQLSLIEFCTISTGSS